MNDPVPRHTSTKVYIKITELKIHINYEKVMDPKEV